MIHHMMLEAQRIGSKSLELMFGYIHSQSFAEVESPLVMVFTGQPFNLNKRWLKSKKNKKE
jgi:hypothetical protein